MKSTVPSPRRVVRRSERAGLAIVWITLVVLLAGGAFWWWRARSSSSAGDAAAAKSAAMSRALPVGVAKARRGDLPLHVEALGTATALQSVVVRSRVDGELVEIAFQEGQLVHAGDPIARIDPRPFQVQLEQAEGQLAKDRALLDNAKRDVARYTEAGEAIPRQQLDTATANVALYEGSVRVDQAQIDSAKLQLDYARITAPITGRIGLRRVDQGNMVHASDANGIAVIAQLQPIAVQFNLPQDALPRVQAAAAAGVLGAEAWNRDRTKQLATGKLAAIDNQIDPDTGTVKLKAVFDNADGALYPNQFVNVRLLVETRRDVVLVPAGAIQRSPTNTFVYVVKDGARVAVQPIELGASEGDASIVTQGLAGGEIIVTEGVDKLVDGTPVVVHEQGAPVASTAPANDADGGGSRRGATGKP